MPKPQVGQVVTLTGDDGTTLPYRIEEVWHDGALLVTPLKPNSGNEAAQARGEESQPMTKAMGRPSPTQASGNTLAP